MTFGQLEPLMNKILVTARPDLLFVADLAMIHVNSPKPTCDAEVCCPCSSRIVTYGILTCSNVALPPGPAWQVQASKCVSGLPFDAVHAAPGLATQLESQLWCIQAAACFRS